MKKFLILVSIVGSYLGAQAQVDPLYAQYLNNPLMINPAYTGLNNNLNASVTYRKQWAGFDGSPSTANVSAHTSLHDSKMGAGIIILQDQAGNSKNTEIQLTYGYRLDLDQKFLSFGLQAGVLNFKSNNNELNPYDPNDPAFNGNQNFTKPSFGAGVILHSERYFFGLSVPRMLKATAKENDVRTNLYDQHFYLTGAYVFFLSERVRLKPSILVKAVKGAPLSADYNFSVNLDEKYTIGAFTRNLNTLGLLAQLKFADAYRFGYTFELPTNRSVGTRFTTHEIMLGINMAIFSFQDTSIKNF
jgi:type IX secretion system PorP/SprF family membrane protein